MEKKRILSICTHNAGRSQMAEGYLRAAIAADHLTRRFGSVT